MLQSMARVGSQVFRRSIVDEDLHALGLSKAIDGEGVSNGHTEGGVGSTKGVKKSRLKNHKASTYEHVHQTIKAGIGACHQLSSRA